MIIGPCDTAGGAACRDSGGEAQEKKTQRTKPGRECSEGRGSS